MKKYISWRRVSTTKQGRSGLGLEAQKEIIRYFIERDRGEWLADYSECYTGTELSGCVELRKAIERCKREGAILIIAKSDRFRNTIEALQVYEEMGDGNIMFCDLPHTDKFTLTLFFALAEREALIVSIRTKQALAAKKARGELIGAACDKYKATQASKDKATLREEQARKGASRTRGYQMSRDVVVFTKVMRNTFPTATSGEPNEWAWNKISLKKNVCKKMLATMHDYADLDSDLFKSWDFSADNVQKLRSYVQAYKKSYTK